MKLTRITPSACGAGLPRFDAEIRIQHTGLIDEELVAADRRLAARERGVVIDRGNEFDHVGIGLRVKGDAAQEEPDGHDRTEREGAPARGATTNRLILHADPESEGHAQRWRRHFGRFLASFRTNGRQGAPGALQFWRVSCDSVGVPAC